MIALSLLFFRFLTIRVCRNTAAAVLCSQNLSPGNLHHLAELLLFDVILELLSSEWRSVALIVMTDCASSQ
jgi:hypothetical protein